MLSVVLEKGGGEGNLRQREQLDEDMKAGKHRTRMGSEEEFYLSGNDESQMEEVFEYKAESILSVVNREPLKFPE